MTLAVAVHRCIRGLPAEERFGLQSQLWRAAVSVPTNIAEGCTRQSTKDYAHFMTIALGSASEVRCLLNLTARLHEVGADYAGLEMGYDEPVKRLQKLVDAMRREMQSRSPKPGAGHPTEHRK